MSGQKFLLSGRFHNHSTIVLYTSSITTKENKMKTINKILLGLAVVGSLTLAAADGASLYKSCASCHGQTGEKKALGKSAIIKGWEATKTIEALNGYKAGTYGGAMKGLMKGQVMSLDDSKIEALAEYIEAQK